MVEKKVEDVKPICLSDLAIGQKARIMIIDTSNKILKRKFLDMGITRGTVVAIKKISPLGDPIDIQIRGYELCLRREDMKMIEVEIIL